MKINRELIIQKAFEQYLQLGYSGVSISVLQKKLDIGRASMYYYFSTKESLFEAVMKRYVVDIIDEAFSPLSKEENLLLTTLIDSLVGMYKKMYDNVQNVDPTLGMNSLSLLILYAMTDDAEFADMIYVRNRQLYRLWIVAIRNSAAAGLIKQDVDVEAAATLFASVRNSFEYVGIQQQTSVENYRQTYQYLYQLLKSNQEIYG